MAADIQALSLQLGALHITEAGKLRVNDQQRVSVKAFPFIDFNSSSVVRRRFLLPDEVKPFYRVFDGSPSSSCIIPPWCTRGLPSSGNVPKRQSLDASTLALGLECQALEGLVTTLDSMAEKQEGLIQRLTQNLEQAEHKLIEESPATKQYAKLMPVKSRDDGQEFHRPQTLQMLPAELIDLIIEVVKPRDLIALRSTCRTLKKYAFDSFSKAFFTERRHILSRHSLETLARVTEHPVFGPLVRCIKLGSCLLDESTLAKLEEKLERSTTEPRLLATQVQRARKEVQATIDEQSILMITRTGPTMLAKALRNIGKHGNKVVLGMCVDVFTTKPTANSTYNGRIFFSGWGAKHAYGKGICTTALQRCIVFKYRPYETIQLLTSAVAESEIMISGIDLQFALDHALISTRNEINTVMDLCWVTKHIKSLTMTRCKYDICPTTQDDSRDWHSARTRTGALRYPLLHPFPIVALRLDASLLSSRLTTDCYSFDNVRILHLTDFSGTLAMFTAPLARCISILTSLTLEHLDVMAPDTVQGLVRWLRDNSQLNHLALYKIFGCKTPGKRRVCLRQAMKRVEFRSAQDVEEGLTRLLETAPYESDVALPARRRVNTRKRPSYFADRYHLSCDYWADRECYT